VILALNAMMMTPVPKIYPVEVQQIVIYLVPILPSLLVFQTMAVVHLHAMPTTTMIAPRSAETM
jgi:hypothetical protein